MNLTIDRQEKYALIKILEPKLTSNVAPELKAEVVMLHHENFKNMIFDLSDVQYCDSSGLSAILTGNRLWKASGGSFVLTGLVHPSVKKLIEISRLDSILSIIPTAEESVEFIFMEEVEKQLHKE